MDGLSNPSQTGTSQVDADNLKAVWYFVAKIMPYVEHMHGSQFKNPNHPLTTTMV